MQHRESFVEMNIDAIVDANATIDIDDVNHDNGVDEYHQLRRTVVLSLIHRSINEDNLIIEYEEVLKEITELSEILENPEKLQGVIEEELTQELNEYNRNVEDTITNYWSSR